MLRHQQAEMHDCVEICLATYTTCQQTALMHCLDLGNTHVEPEHFRMMADCANACRAAARVISSGAAHYEEYCRLCADICRECAASCAGLGDMDECVRSCRRCAQSCEELARASLTA